MCSDLELIELAAGGAQVVLGVANRLLLLLQRLPGPLGRGLGPLQPLLRRRHLPLRRLAAAGGLLAGAALGRLVLGPLALGRRGGGRSSEPDRDGSLLALEPSQLDRPGDLGVA